MKENDDEWRGSNGWEKLFRSLNDPEIYDKHHYPPDSDQQAFKDWSEILRSNKKTEDARIRSEMKHELASIMWDVTNRRGYHA